MSRQSPYTDAQKAAILEAVKTARKTGTWPDALKAAQDAGYKGGLPYLMKFAGGSKRRGRKPSKAAPVATSKVKGKRGRPKGSKNTLKRGPGRPKSNARVGNGLGLADIDKIVARMVEQRVGAAVAKAVKALEAAAGELKRL